MIENFLFENLMIRFRKIYMRIIKISSYKRLYFENEKLVVKIIIIIFENNKQMINIYTCNSSYSKDALYYLLRLNVIIIEYDAFVQHVELALQLIVQAHLP